MISKAQKIRLGIFIAIGSMLILLFAGVVAGNRLFQRKDIYYIEYEDFSVSGLQVGGSVLYHGIKVGRVESIKINPKDVSKVVITIAVEKGTPIKEDVEAVLILVGITGLKSVELRGGSNASPLLKPKSYIKAGVSTFDDISGKALSIAEKVDLIASNIAKITDQENQKNIAQILEQTNLMLTDVRLNLSSTLQNLSKIIASTSEIAGAASSNLETITQATTKQIDSIGTNVNLLILDTRKQVNQIGNKTDNLIVQTSKDIAAMTMSINGSLDRINQLLSKAEFDSLIVNTNTISAKLAASDLQELVANLNGTVIRLNSLVSNLDRTVTRGRTDFVETLESLREAAENLNEFTKQISENPSLLLIGK